LLGNQVVRQESNLGAAAGQRCHGLLHGFLDPSGGLVFVEQGCVAALPERLADCFRWAVEEDLGYLWIAQELREEVKVELPVVSEQFWAELSGPSPSRGRLSKLLKPGYLFERPEVVKTCQVSEFDSQNRLLGRILAQNSGLRPGI